MVLQWRRKIPRGTKRPITLKIGFNCKSVRILFVEVEISGYHIDYENKGRRGEM